MKESQLEFKAMKLFHALPNSWWTKVSQRDKKGTPDRIGVYNGRLIALEFKRNTKAKIAPLQKYTLQKIREAGGIAEIVHDKNYKEVYERIKNDKARKANRRD